MSGSYAYHSGDVPGLAGAYHYGDGGLGIPGSLIPSSGDHGPGYIYPSLVLPADANREYYGVLGALPAGLTIAVDENSAVTAAATDGTYRVPFDLYEDGAKLGSTYFDVAFGVVTAGAGTVNLTAAPSTETPTTSTGAATVTPAAPRVVNLVAANSTETPTSSTGAATVTPPPKTVNLTPAPSTETPTSGTGAATVAAPILPVNPEFLYVGGVFDGYNFPDVVAGDSVTLSYDFKRCIPAGATILSVVSHMVAHVGTDPDPGAMVTGGPTIDGAIVSVQVCPTLAGVSYWPRVTATYDDGEKKTLPEHGEGSLAVTQ